MTHYLPKFKLPFATFGVKVEEMKIFVVNLLVSTLIPFTVARFSLAGLTSWFQSELTRDHPIVLSHRCNSAAPANESFKFLAFFVAKSDYEHRIDCTPLGSAAIVTNTLAVTAASVIDLFAYDISSAVLLTGGFEECRPYVCRSVHDIRRIKYHPLYYYQPPFGDIGVVSLSNPIDMAQEGVSPIPLKLENVYENLLVNQLGWDDPMEIINDNTRNENHWRWEVALRRFHIKYYRSNMAHRYLFKSDPEYTFTPGDYGGPVFVCEETCQLVAVTSRTHERYAEFVKIYNLLPFLAEEIQIDRNERPNDEASAQDDWITNLFRDFIIYPANTLL